KITTLSVAADPSSAVFLPEMLSSTTGDSHGKQNRFQKKRLFQQTQLFMGASSPRHTVSIGPDLPGGALRLSSIEPLYLEL
ncbi:MAG TPA: hypothetical protein VOA64_01745, partial [Candidatus Dormibacteraeota bacterium]|nr:hypothetical protein [Candidatus Dormibacteraeota bacterium]